jgi:hypothetical protein
MLTAGLSSYFENAAGRLLEHPDGYLYFQYYPGKRTFTNLQALLVHTSILLQRKKWVKVLGDQRLMSPFTAQKRAYILEHWLAYGLHSPAPIYAAVLVANDVFARLVASQVQHEAKAPSYPTACSSTRPRCLAPANSVGWPPRPLL